MSGNARGPSTAFNLLYRLAQLQPDPRQVRLMLDHKDSPYIRAVSRGVGAGRRQAGRQASNGADEAPRAGSSRAARPGSGTRPPQGAHPWPPRHPLQVGFLYLRYTGDPRKLWGWFERYLRDTEVRALQPASVPLAGGAGRGASGADPRAQATAAPAPEVTAAAPAPPAGVQPQPGGRAGPQDGDDRRVCARHSAGPGGWVWVHWGWGGWHDTSRLARACAAGGGAADCRPQPCVSACSRNVLQLQGRPNAGAARSAACCSRSAPNSCRGQHC